MAKIEYDSSGELDDFSIDQNGKVVSTKGQLGDSESTSDDEITSSQSSYFSRLDWVNHHRMMIDELSDLLKIKDYNLRHGLSSTTAQSLQVSLGLNTITNRNRYLSYTAWCNSAQTLCECIKSLTRRFLSSENIPLIYSSALCILASFYSEDVSYSARLMHLGFILASISVIKVSNFGSLVAIILCKRTTNQRVSKGSEMTFFAKQTADLKSLRNLAVQCLRDAEFVTLHAINLVVGDIVKIEPGNSIPADGRIIELESGPILVDESLLFGIDRARTRKLAFNVRYHNSIFEAENMVFGGSKCVSGTFFVIITSTGDASVLGRLILQSMEPEIQTNYFEAKTKNLTDFFNKMIIISTFIALLVFSVLIKGFKTIETLEILILATFCWLPLKINDIYQYLNKHACAEILGARCRMSSPPRKSVLGQMTKFAEIDTAVIQKRGFLTSRELKVGILIAGTQKISLERLWNVSHKRPHFIRLNSIITGNVAWKSLWNAIKIMNNKNSSSGSSTSLLNDSSVKGAIQRLMDQYEKSLLSESDSRQRMKGRYQRSGGEDSEDNSSREKEKRISKDFRKKRIHILQAFQSKASPSSASDGYNEFEVDSRMTLSDRQLRKSVKSRRMSLGTIQEEFQVVRPDPEPEPISEILRRLGNVRKVCFGTKEDGKRSIYPFSANYKIKLKIVKSKDVGEFNWFIMMQGGLESVLKRCNSRLGPSGVQESLSQKETEKLLKTVTEESRQHSTDYRIVALACKLLPLSKYSKTHIFGSFLENCFLDFQDSSSFCFIGSMAAGFTPRPWRQLRDQFLDFENLGIQPIIASEQYSDYKGMSTAHRIAQRCGFFDDFLNQAEMEIKLKRARGGVKGADWRADLQVLDSLADCFEGKAGEVISLTEIDEDEFDAESTESVGENHDNLMGYQGFGGPRFGFANLQRQERTEEVLSEKWKGNVIGKIVTKEMINDLYKLPKDHLDESRSRGVHGRPREAQDSNLEEKVAEFGIQKRAEIRWSQWLRNDRLYLSNVLNNFESGDQSSLDFLAKMRSLGRKIALITLQDHLGGLIYPKEVDLMINPQKEEESLFNQTPSLLTKTTNLGSILASIRLSRQLRANFKASLVLAQVPSFGLFLTSILSLSLSGNPFLFASLTQSFIICLFMGLLTSIAFFTDRSQLPGEESNQRRNSSKSKIRAHLSKFSTGFVMFWVALISVFSAAASIGSFLLILSNYGFMVEELPKLLTNDLFLPNK